MSNIEQATPNVVKSLIEMSIASGVPLYIHGSPGLAKSSLVAQVADEKGYRVEDFRLVNCDAVDIAGAVYVDNGRTRKAPPFELPSDPDEKVILFFDEFAQADPLVMNAAAQLVYDRKVGEYKLPDPVRIILASNRRSDRAAVSEVPSHIRNRVFHVELVPSTDDWIHWAAEKKIHPEVIAYLSYQGGSLNKFSPDEMAYPTPRSWEFVSKLLESGGSRYEQNIAINGTIGRAVGSDFGAFRVNYEKVLPIVRDVLAGNRPAFPPKPDEMYSVTTALAFRANRSNWRLIADFFMSYRGARSDELVAMAFAHTLKLRPELRDTAEHVEYISKFGGDLLK